MYSDRYALRNGLPTVKPKQVSVSRARVALVTAAEAASVLQLHPDTVRGWVRNGRRGMRLEPSVLLDFIRKTNGA